VEDGGRRGREREEKKGAEEKEQKRSAARPRAIVVIGSLCPILFFIDRLI
jgi:hypothetical protein